MPNKLSQFWQELKRRKVTRTITVYAAAAFAILELISMSQEPFGLPDWSFVLAVILLSIGFLIAVIVSWIYDIHPEEGVVKTEPAHKVQEAEIPKSPKSWKIASYISFVVIVGLIVLNVIPRSDNKKNFDKSIAVLSFINNSPDTVNEYVINGYRAAIHDKLCRIEDLRVLALSSTEQYQEHQKPYKELARELHVGYLLYASGQELGKQIRLIVQLMDADANIIWSNPYDRQISSVQDHIDIQSDIAQNVAGQIGVIISPINQQLMDKAPTTDLTAYDLILQAQKYFNQYTSTKDRENLERLSQLCKLALDLDPDFALAYYWLGKSALSERTEDYMLGALKPFYLDTALFFFNRALELDPDLPEAYAERGIFYMEKAQIPLAIAELKKAIKISPNNLTACLNSGYVYYYSRDYKNALINMRKAETLIRSHEMLINLYRDLGFLYAAVGDWEKAEGVVNKMMPIHPQYGLLGRLMVLTLTEKEYDSELLQVAEEFIDHYPDNKYGYEYMARSLLDLGRTQEAEDCIRTMLQYGEPDVNNAHRVGFIFWMSGKRDEAMEYFNLQIDYCLESLDTNIYGQTNAAYDLAGVYAFLGEKEEAIRWLREYERLGFMSGMQDYIRIDPLFDKLRNDEEFKEIVTRVNEKTADLRAEMQEMEEY